MHVTHITLPSADGPPLRVPVITVPRSAFADLAPEGRDED